MIREKQLLGMVVRADRRKAGYSQGEVDERARATDPHFHIRSQWCGVIERGIARSVTADERRLMAKVLGQPEEKYLHLEVDPREVIADLVRPSAKRQYPTLERSIEFPPEYKEAGVAILSYFSRVIESKYPNEDVKVTIVQQQNLVTLRVESPGGRIEEIERDLQEYGLVVTGRKQIAELTEDRELIRDLRTKLEVTHLELKLRREAQLEQRKQYDQRVLSLESQVERLNDVVTAGLSQTSSIAALLQTVAPVAQVTSDVARSIERIVELATATHSDENEAALASALTAVRVKAPTVYERLRERLAAIPPSVMANLATPWVQDILRSLPH